MENRENCQVSLTNSIQEKLIMLMAEIEQLQTRSVINAIEMGKRWKIIHDEKLWKAIDDAHSFREFCQKEARVSHTTVYNLMNVYEKFGHLLENRNVKCEITRLVKALPYVTNDNAEQWLHIAEAAIEGHYEDYIREARGKIAKADCLHEELEDWRRCRTCGAWVKENQ